LAESTIDRSALKLEIASRLLAHESILEGGQIVPDPCQNEPARAVVHGICGVARGRPTWARAGRGAVGNDLLSSESAS
jgi:hypothetical protein